MSSPKDPKSSQASNIDLDKTVVHAKLDERAADHSKNAFDEAFEARTIVQPMPRDHQVPPPPSPFQATPPAPPTSAASTSIPDSPFVKKAQPPSQAADKDFGKEKSFVNKSQASVPDKSFASKSQVSIPDTSFVNKSQASLTTKQVVGAMNEEVTGSWPLDPVVPPVEPKHVAPSEAYSASPEEVYEEVVPQPNWKERLPVIKAQVQQAFARFAPKNRPAMIGLGIVILIPVLVVLFAGGEGGGEGNEATDGSVATAESSAGNEAQQAPAPASETKEMASEAPAAPVPQPPVQQAAQVQRQMPAVQGAETILSQFDEAFNRTQVQIRSGSQK